MNTIVDGYLSIHSISYVTTRKCSFEDAVIDPRLVNCAENLRDRRDEPADGPVNILVILLEDFLHSVNPLADVGDIVFVVVYRY